MSEEGTMKIRPERFTWEPGDIEIIDDGVEKHGAVTFAEAVEKFNPYHDTRGRFSSADGSASFTIRANVDSKVLERAKDKEALRTTDLLASGAIPPDEPKNKPFTPAKNIAEAEKYLRDQGVAYVNLKGFDLEIANGILEQHAFMREHYPEGIKNIKCITNTQEQNKLVKRYLGEKTLDDRYGGKDGFKQAVLDGRLPVAKLQLQAQIDANPSRPRQEVIDEYTEIVRANYIDIYSKRVRVGSVKEGDVALSTNATWGPYEGISYNAKQVKNAKALNAMWQKCEAVGFHPKGTGDPKTVFTHESAHQIDNVLKQHPAIRKQVVDNIFVTAMAYNGGIAGNVSRYATKNTEEFFAEAFTEYIHNPNPRPIAAMVGRTLDAALVQIRGGK